MSTMTAKEVASKFETTPKTLRKFLRTEVKAAGGAIGVDSPGKGGRWAIDAKSVPAMKKRFADWAKAQAEANAKRLADLANAQGEGDDEVEADEAETE